MLKERIITAVVASALIFGLLYFFPQFIVMIVLLSVLFSTYETSAMITPALLKRIDVKDQVVSKNSLNFVNLWLPVIIAGVIFIVSAIEGTKVSSGVMVSGFLLVMFLSSFMSETIDSSVMRAIGSVFSVCYGLLPWLAFWQIFLVGDLQVLLYLLIIVWAGDTTAFFVGRKFGKRKLAPKRSPNKTVEGALGGIAASVVIAYVLGYMVIDIVNHWWVLFFIGLFCGASAQVGDLFESSLKRFSQVKDSGGVFPGHGGFLDRVDGVMFAVPVFWFILFCCGSFI